MKITIIILSSILLIIFTIGIINKKLTVKKIGEYVSIIGVVIGLLIYFDLAPQTVIIDKKKQLMISSFEAVENISANRDTAFYMKNSPDFYFSAYLTNIGELPLSDLKVSFQFDNDIIEALTIDFLDVYLYNGINPIVKLPKKHDWLSMNAGNYYISNYDKYIIYHFDLPPLLENESVSILVGYKNQFYSKGGIGIPHEIVKSEVELSVIEKGMIEPMWSHNRNDIDNYEEKKITKDVVYDTKSTKFRRLKGYFWRGF
jgi:hypothetical protein